MVGEKRPPYPRPNPVVSPDVGTHDPTPSRGGDVGFQHGSPGMDPMQDGGIMLEGIGPKERRSSVPSKRTVVGTESLGKL